MRRNFLFSLLYIIPCLCAGDNQTATITPVLSSSNLPFQVAVELLDMELPNGWHSGAIGKWNDQWLLLAGRTNGLHGFSNDPNVNNFPPSAQNTMLYVIDFKKGRVWQRSLKDPSSGLTQEQIDFLSVTSPQSYQSDKTLYMTGGYGIDSATGQMNTKPILTAIDIPALINWVIEPKIKGASKSIRQISDPLLQVTGGYMDQIDPHLPTLLTVGQNFMGFYRDGSNGEYTNQVRSFHIVDNGKKLHIAVGPQPKQNPAYRRRDLNVVPILHPGNVLEEGYAILSGVFTKSGGIWTVPILVSADGKSFMPDPDDPDTFKQAMNNYACPTVGLYSACKEEMYIVLFGGMTYGYFQNGSFETDSEIPFTNQITTIKIDRKGKFSQHLMANEYPVILSTFSNPGNQLLFGAGAFFIPKENLPTYSNHVVALDKLKYRSCVLGYIVGGIQSTLPNTSSEFDSAASPYIFRVVLYPNLK